MSPDHRQAALAANFLSAPVRVDGQKLRPLSAASFQILKRTRNAFVTGSDDPDARINAAMEFVFVHGAPLDDVIEATSLPSPRATARALDLEFAEFLELSVEYRLSARTEVMLDQFAAAVLRYNAQIPLELSEAAQDEIEQETGAAASGLVEAKPKGSDTDAADPN